MVTKNVLKYIKSLKNKKNRVREGKFLVEGLKNVRELLQSDFEIEQVLCTKEYANHFASRYDIVTLDQLNSISTLSNNESCLAVAKIMPFGVPNLEIGDHIVMLDGVRDPGNLGTIIRSLDWFGFNQLICSEDCADMYNPKAIAASMGSFCRVRVHYGDLGALILTASRKCYALTLDGTSLPECQFGERGIFILGSESHGIRPDIQGLADEEVTVPQIGQAESLNVAMTSSVLLYQLRFGKS